MNHKTREQTNSITHLVKIVANEIFDERVERHNANKAAERKEWIVDRAGEIWPDKEDKVLVDEFNDAVCEIAKKHGRTYGAITARFRLLGLGQ